MIKKVLVIGLGLIGGSMALAIRQSKKAIIAGYDINKSSIEQAISLGVIDYGTTIDKGAKDADLIILATPVDIIQKILLDLSKLELKPTTIITDVGSTKRHIVNEAKHLFAGRATFIGGHPMAGSHKSGVLASKSHLFENAFYFLTPDETVESEKVTLLKNYLEGTKATFLTINPKQHDEVVGVISHFPHVIASSLVHQLSHFNSGELNMSRLAAGGFRDITRIASSDPTMWQRICMDNRDVLLHLFDSWDQIMTKMKKALIENNEHAIFSFFKNAKDYRDQIPTKDKGVMPSYYDLYVDVPDYPGIIAKITEIIAKNGISITNIRIIELRENILGVLRISFQTDTARESASKLLQAHNYKTFVDE